MAASLLIVEDDDGIAAPLQRALTREGYEVERVATGADALAHIDGTRPDLTILDLGLPDMDGLEVCRRLRHDGYDCPILILTARGDELDMVVGLDAGADDYMSKPFGLAELSARVRALLRRVVTNGQGPETSPDPVEGLDVDVAARRVWVDDEEIHLTTKEFGVLALLVADPGAVVTREDFMDQVWDEHWYGSTKTLDVTVARLRQKLADAGSSAVITAVRGVGFRLDAAGA